MTPRRNTFIFVFTMTLAGVLLIVTGLIGYDPPAHLSLDAGRGDVASGPARSS